MLNKIKKDWQYSVLCNFIGGGGREINIPNHTSGQFHETVDMHGETKNQQISLLVGFCVA